MADLLIMKTQATQTLDEFVKELPVLLGCGPWEQRESSNYPPEDRYFRCCVLGLELVVCVADESEFTDYDFRLHFTPEFRRDDRQFLTELADCTARRLAIRGYDVLRPFDPSRSGKGGLRYRFDREAGSMPWEMVVTQQM
jgi:hypothetical protein